MTKGKKIENDMAQPRTTCTTRGWQNPIFIKNDVSETGKKIGNFHNFETTMGVPQLWGIGPAILPKLGAVFGSNLGYRDLIWSFHSVMAKSGTFHQISISKSNVLLII